MKNLSRKIHLLYYYLGGILLITSCEKNFLDFSKIENPSLNSEWGIHLVDVQYTLNDFLHHIENNPYIVTTDQNTINFTYQTTLDNILEADNYLNFNGFHLQKDFTIDITNFTAKNFSDTLSYEFVLPLDNDLVLLKSATIDSCVMQFQLQHNFPLQVQLILSSSELRTSNGSPFSHTFIADANMGLQNLNLSQFQLVTNSQNEVHLKVDLVVEINEYDNIPSNLTYFANFVSNFSDFKIYSLEGYLSSISLPFTQSIDLGIDFSNFGGEIQIFDPQVVLSSRNSFGVEGICRLDEMAFYSNDQHLSSLIPSPLTLSVPISQTFTPQTITLNSPITFSTESKTILFSGEIAINPNGFEAGLVQIDKYSSIGFAFDIEIPLKININDFIYVDTFNLNLDKIPNIQQINDLSLRFDFNNGLPFDLKTQLYFCNSNFEITDSLLSSPLLLNGSYYGEAVPAAPAYIQFSNTNDLNNLLTSDNVILKARLNTQQPVVIGLEQFLKLNIAAKATINPFEK